MTFLLVICYLIVTGLAFANNASECNRNPYIPSPVMPPVPEIISHVDAEIQRRSPVIAILSAPISAIYRVPSAGSIAIRLFRINATATCSTLYP